MTMNTLNGSERRTTRRIPFDTAVGCDVGDRHILDYTADLSLGGLYVRTNKLNAAPGSPVKITLRVPGMPKRATVDGFVVRTDPGENGGVAIRFASLPADVDAALAKLTGEEIIDVGDEAEFITDEIELVEQA
jgi:hypothetical protein